MELESLIRALLPIYNTIHYNRILYTETQVDPMNAQNTSQNTPQKESVAF